MSAFLEAIGSAISTIFSAITGAFKDIGNMIFTFGEQGALSGLTPAGYIVALLIGIPLATWIFSMGWKAITSLGGKLRGR